MNHTKHNKNVKVAHKKGYRVNKKGEVISHIGNNLSLGEDENGYKRFTIRNNGKRVSIKVHKLVGFQKFGEKALKKDVHIRHLDNDNQNNSPENIELGTQSDNMMDKPKKDRVINASNRSFEYNEIRNFYNECRSYKKTMKEFTIKSKGTLHYILNNKNEILEEHYNK